MYILVLPWAAVLLFVGYKVELCRSSLKFTRDPFHVQTLQTAPSPALIPTEIPMGSHTTLAEFQDMLKKRAVSEEMPSVMPGEAKAAFTQADLDSDGLLGEGELEAAMASLEGFIRQKPFSGVEDGAGEELSPSTLTLAEKTVESIGDAG